MKKTLFFNRSNWEPLNRRRRRRPNVKSYFFVVPFKSHFILFFQVIVFWLLFKKKKGRGKVFLYQFVKGCWLFDLPWTFDFSVVCMCVCIGVWRICNICIIRNSEITQTRFLKNKNSLTLFRSWNRVKVSFNNDL